MGKERHPAGESRGRNPAGATGRDVRVTPPRKRCCWKIVAPRGVRFLGTLPPSVFEAAVQTACPAQSTPMSHVLRTALFTTLASSLGSTGLSAQNAPPASADDPIEMSHVVVTGRAGLDFRTKAQTSYAITDVSGEQLRLQAPIGVAEAIKNVPGFWVEASGGEASANVRARGIPTEGYSTVALHEDGLPVQHDSGLGWMNADQSFRLDETIERLEVVRGGPSSVFASNAPGGTVNFVTRRGTDTPSGVIKYETGDFGRHRVDAWYGGPAGDWRYSVGGFWRIDDGIRDPGFRANDGYQFRFSLGRDFGRGKIDFNLKHLDDKVIFFLGVPLTFDASGDPAEVPGFDANHGTFPGPETARVTVRDANGTRTIAVDNGTDVNLTQATLRFEYDLGGGWRLQNGFRYRDSDTVRNGVFPGSITAGPARLAALRTSALTLFPGAVDVQFRYVTSPSTVFDPLAQNGNGLVHDASIRSISVALEEIINDLRVLRKFEVGGQTHDLALGYYLGHSDEGFRRYSANAYTDVRSRARLLDLVAVDAAGAPVGVVTENGFSRYGAEYANGLGDSTTHAFYASDEWQVTRALRIDLGARWERIGMNGSVERSTSRNLGGTTLADDNVLAGTGQFDHFDRSFDRLGWTLGADWLFTPRSGVFARYTPTFRLPSVGDFITNATALPIVQRMDLYEAGYKYTSRAFDAFATAFYTEYKNLGFTESVFDPVSGGYSNRTAYTNTKAYGLELETLFRPTAWFDLNATATVQQPEYGDFRFTQLVNGQPTEIDYTGNQLVRVPKLSLRVIPGFNLMDGRLRLQLPIEHYGRRYSDAANSVSLPSYTVLNANARFDLSPRVSLYLYADNLTNEIGLTEGNPRTGQFQSGDAGARYYFARPILGRSYRAAVMVRF